MNVKIFIQGILLLAANICYGQYFLDNHKDLKSLNLKGHVKSISETSFNAQLKSEEYIKTSKGWLDNWSRDNFQVFDSSGNLKEKIYYSNEKIESKDFYRIKDNLLIEVSIKFKTSLFTYDKNGRLLTEKLTKKQPSVIKTGNEKLTKDETSIIKYQYDGSNRIIKKIEKNLKGNILSTENLKYDAKGNIALKEIEYEDSMEYEKYYYDSNNNLIKTEYSDSEEGLLETYIFTYENSKKVFERNEYYEEGKLQGFIETKFVNEVESNITEVDNGKVILQESYFYDYDSLENWVRMIVTRIDKTYKSKTFIVERKIEYY